MIDNILYCEGDILLLEVETGILGDLNQPLDILSDRAVELDLPEKTVGGETNYVYG